MWDYSQWPLVSLVVEISLFGCKARCVAVVQKCMPRFLRNALASRPGVWFGDFWREF